MQMQAAVLAEFNKPFQIETVDLAPPKTGEVLIKMAAAGVCHSDWHVVEGLSYFPLPIVCGHEGAGVVEAVGEGVTRVQPGDHVILNFRADCGECFYCQNDKAVLCEEFSPTLKSGLPSGRDQPYFLGWRSGAHYDRLGMLRGIRGYPASRLCADSRRCPAGSSRIGRLRRFHRCRRSAVHRRRPSGRKRRGLWRRRHWFEHYPRGEAVRRVSHYCGGCQQHEDGAGARIWRDAHVVFRRLSPWTNPVAHIGTRGRPRFRVCGLSALQRRRSRRRDRAGL